MRNVPKSHRAQTLNAQQQIFVQEYLAHGNATQAALKAGYSTKNAAQAGWSLLQNQIVLKALEEGKKESYKRLGYGLDEAMKEAQECIDFAKQTDNANAYAKAVELRAKLNGLIIDKHDVRSLGNFKLVIEGVRDSPALPAAIDRISLPQVELPHEALPLPGEEDKVSTTDQETDYSELFD